MTATATPTASNEVSRAAPELVCPAGSLPALKAAIDGGADCVYLGLRDATNARNFAGLNFDEAAIQTGRLIARGGGAGVDWRRGAPADAIAAGVAIVRC